MILFLAFLVGFWFGGVVTVAWGILKIARTPYHPQCEQFQHVVENHPLTFLKAIACWPVGLWKDPPL